MPVTPPILGEDIRQWGRQLNLFLTRKTNSDCESIIKGYEKVGCHIVNMLDGVFSFVYINIRN